MPSLPLDQKVRQLDNDVQAIYELISTIEMTQRRQLNRLTELGNDVAAVKVGMGGLEAKLGQVEDKVGQVEGKVDQVIELLTER